MNPKFRRAVQFEPFVPRIDKPLTLNLKHCTGSGHNVAGHSPRARRATCGVCGKVVKVTKFGYLITHTEGTKQKRLTNV